MYLAVKKNKMDKPIYVFSRVRATSDKLYGATHAASNPFDTLCGLETDQNWWLISNEGKGKITCKKCLRGIKD